MPRKCTYPDKHEWRLIHEGIRRNTVGSYAGATRRFYCIHCRIIEEDKD